MKLTKQLLNKFIIEAFCGFVLWTLILTPYVVFVTKMSLYQYVSWLLMQLIVVPFASILVVNITNWVVKKVV